MNHFSGFGGLRTVSGCLAPGPGAKRQAESSLECDRVHMGGGEGGGSGWSGLHAIGTLRSLLSPGTSRPMEGRPSSVNKAQLSNH